MKWGIILRLAALAYFEVCAGPFSIELAVKAAGGPVGTLVGIPILLLLWVIPVIEVTARLVEITEHKDGGCIVWVHELLDHSQDTSTCISQSSQTPLTSLCTQPLQLDTLTLWA